MPQVTVVSDELLNTTEAARRLGISRITLYDWLAQSNSGMLMIRSQSITVDYLQGGAQGQGRIQIATAEIERLKEAMRVQPQRQTRRRSRSRPQHYPGINVPLGRPDD
jgi:hypothetical protein